MQLQTQAMLIATQPEVIKIKEEAVHQLRMFNQQLLIQQAIPQELALIMLEQAVQTPTYHPTTLLRIL
jgi:hypothetical protein